MDVSKIKLIEERLNEKPNSLYLHDAGMENLILYGEQLIITFGLGLYNYYTNSHIFKDVVNEDCETELLIREIFDGVKIKIFDFAIEDIGADVLGVDDFSLIDKNTIRIEIFGFDINDYESRITNPVIEFEFKSFKREIIGEKNIDNR
ncbi:MAG: hypothetical protein RR201_02805 [Malacoplasma sp.]